jgi:hypothetical protein
MTGGPAGPPLIGLELQLDGLRPRVRLLFEGGTLPALWFLAGGADLELLLDDTHGPEDAVLAPSWMLGPTPMPGELRRILRSLEIPTTLPLVKACRRPLHRARLRARRVAAF